MTTQMACPTCGTLMQEIVWGYDTIADVADAGDVAIGGCVIDVDDVGRVAALQCPACGTRTDEHGIALERPAPATTEHPFGVAFSSSQHPRQEVTMREQSDADGDVGRAEAADSSTFLEEDFGGIASGGDWREHVEPYASREDELPQSSASVPERVEPYASREDEIPERTASAPERVEPYASREDEIPERAASAPDRVEPYASREDQLPERGASTRDSVDPYESREDSVPERQGTWREHIDPFAAEPGSQGVPGEPMPGDAVDAAAVEAGPGDAGPGNAGPSDTGPGDAVPSDTVPSDTVPGDTGPGDAGEAIDAHSLDTSDFTDAEEEGWPARGPE